MLFAWWTIRKLKSSDVRVRIEAMKKLGEAREVSAVGPIADMLEDDERAVRAAAAQTLGKIGRPSAIPYLIDMLMKERSWDLRHEAVEALRQIGDPAAVNELLVTIEGNNPDQGLQQIAAWALKEFGWEQLTAAQQAMVTILRDEWDQLPAIGSPAVDAILAAMRTGTPRVRREAVTALGKIGDTRALGALQDLLNDADPEISQWAAWALEQYAWERLEPQQLVRVSIQLEKWNTVIDLGMTAVGVLLELLRMPEFNKRQEALQALGRIGGPQAVRALTKFMKDRDESIRYAASRAVAGIINPKSTDALVKALHEENFEIAMAAAAALGNLDWRPENLADEALWAVSNGEWQKAARFGPAAIEPLVRALSHSSLRTKAMETLVAIGAQALPTLLSLLQNDTPSMRICAVEALADIGDPQAVPALVNVLEKDELGVKRAAFAGLERLGWSPPDAAKRARIAIALEEWWQLPEMGPAALPVLMELFDDDTRSNQALYAIEQILQGEEAAKISLEVLQRLASLMNAPSRGGVQGRLPQGGKALQTAVARRRVSQLARALLQKRGSAAR